MLQVYFTWRNVKTAAIGKTINTYGNYIWYVKNINDEFLPKRKRRRDGERESNVNELIFIFHMKKSTDTNSDKQYSLHQSYVLNISSTVDSSEDIMLYLD